jgi:thiol-disulfide isomerase/thioredoxin
MLPALIGVIVFLLIAWGLYTLYTSTSKQAAQQQLQDISNANPNGKTIVIYMFHVDWCPHCKKAMPEWKQFVDEYNGKLIGGYTIECKDVDCTDSKSATIKALTDKFEVTQFPTIKGVMPDEKGKEITVDYDAKVKKTNLEQFVLSMAQ